MLGGKYLIAFCSFVFFSAATEAADLPIPKSRAAPALGNGLPMNCLEWTDGCRVCARQQDGSTACSNVGIACVPQQARCTRP